MKKTMSSFKAVVVFFCIIATMSLAVLGSSYPAKNSNDPKIDKKTSFTVSFKISGKDLEKEISKFKGKNILTSGSAVGDYCIGYISGRTVKIPNVAGATFAFTTAVVTDAVEAREKQIDTVLKDIYNGAKGIEVTATCKPIGYPVVDLKFKSYK